VVAAYYAVWLLLEARRRRLGRSLVFSAASMLLALTAVYALKAALRVPRPVGAGEAAGAGLAWLLLHADAYSYPSGHAAKATVVARTIPARGAAKAALWAWALLVYASRLALGAHWLGDVAGGALAGLASAETVEASWGAVAGAAGRLAARLGLECC
jgi:membrane-associated phospholipid phosphatase